MQLQFDKGFPYCIKGGGNKNFGNRIIIPEDRYITKPHSTLNQ